jgi:hypothetical protein
LVGPAEAAALVVRRAVLQVEAVALVVEMVELGKMVRLTLEAVAVGLRRLPTALEVAVTVVQVW